MNKKFLKIIILIDKVRRVLIFHTKSFLSRLSLYSFQYSFQRASTKLRNLPQKIKNFFSVSENEYEKILFYKNQKLIQKTKNNIAAMGDKFLINIKFKKELNPKVTIVIPIFKNKFYTYLCLYSISIAKTEVPFEVIIIDDSGKGNTIDSLQDIANIRIINNDINIGYLRSCNQSIKYVNSEFVYFLNNDTFVIDYWLDSLVDTFNFFPDVGIVGSKLYYENGIVQECGSYILSNGQGYNFGRNYDDFSSILNFTREVDYCSASSILFRKKDFIEFGMFDENFLPAYYEDVDLCFKFKSKGKKILCNPKSRIFHFESKTIGSMLNKKELLIEKNKKIFFTKWKSFIDNKFHKIENLKDKNKYIIFCEEHVLTPFSDAGSLSIFNFAKLFQELGFSVIFYFENIDQDINIFKDNGFHVLTENIVTRTRGSLKKILQNFYIYPSIFYISRPNFYNKIYPFLKREYKNSLFIYDTVDLHFLRMSREKNIHNSSWTNNQISVSRDIEIDNILKSDFTIIRSIYEVNYLIDKYKINLNKLINLSLLFKSTEDVPLFSDTNGLVFVANFNHQPNIDALNYFFDNIFIHFSPNFLKENIHIVGKNGKKLFGHKVNNKNIIFYDFIKDINSFLFKRRVNIAPLRYGAGIKGKIAQAMTIGIPTVSTPIGFEGINLKSKRNFCTSNPKLFAELIQMLYYDPKLWNKIQKIQHDYSQIWTLDFNYKLLKTKLAKRVDMPNKIFTTNFL